MKTNFTYTFLVASFLLILQFFFSIQSKAQPDYDFRNHVLLSGTDGEIGAVYLFPAVKTGVDARMTITDLSTGIKVIDLDGASGFPEALQPTLDVKRNTNGYLEMQFEFLYAGTSTPYIQREVPVTCIDVDGVANLDGRGNSLNEFDEINLSGGYADYQLSGGELSVVQVGNWFNGKNVGNVEYPGRDTAAKQVMFTVVNGNISSLIIRVGVDNQSTIRLSRLRSVYFKKFVYPNSVLSRSSLRSFSGVERNSSVSLQWKLEKENNLKMVRIERGNGSSDFTTIGEISVDETNSQQINFSFQDNKSFEGNVSYRLQLIAENGGIKYSNVLMFHLGNMENDFKMYPSVIQTSATVQIKSETLTTAKFQLIDYSGKVLLQKNIKMHEGINDFTINNLDLVPPGNYIAVIKINNKLYNQKVIRP